MPAVPFPKVRPRNPRGQGVRLREQIVAAATDIFQETGNRSRVTLRAIARRIGIAPTSIYPHFQHIDAIVETVVDATFDELTEYLRSAAEIDEPVGRLRAMCDAYVAFGRAHPGRYCLLFGGAPPVPPEPALTTGAMPTAFGLLLAGIVDCVRAGRSASVDPVGDAIALWIALHGYVQLRTANPDVPWPPDSAVIANLVAKLGAITAPPDGPGPRLP